MQSVSLKNRVFLMKDMPLPVMLDVQILSGEDPVVEDHRGNKLEYEDSFEDETAINSPEEDTE